MESKHTAFSNSGDAPCNLENQKAEPIAIVGLACRLPGDASSGSKFWELLVNDQSGQCDFPPNRLNGKGFYKSKGDLAGSFNMTGGYFIHDDIRAFENEFFGINNLEAKYMDPQQRKLLETTFECLETAGVPLERISGSNTGCYVGNFSFDSTVMQTRDIDGIHRYSLTGMESTILANRISHTFNLTGPSVVLSTACSSSMYCLHTACVALETGDCDGAIVAAANLIQSVEQHIGVMKAGVLSKTSTCHSFDASADGYGRADAVGVLYLKRLSDAIRDGDPIRSVIRATAVNSNGKTQGITLPSADHQVKVIRKAYVKAGLSVDKTTYVECHGTGTPVGDPVEVEAVSRVFRAAGIKTRSLKIGSVKTNIGHGGAASAISGIIKVTLALEKGYIPATIGVTRINPKINCVEMGVDIVTKGHTWQSSDERFGSSLLRAGVNSFGYGGANGHAILDNAQTHIPPNYDTASQILPSARSIYLLPFSASTSEGIAARINDLSTYNLKTTSIQDLAYTLGCRRSHLEKRGYILASGKEYYNAVNFNNLRGTSRKAGQTPSRFAFIFTGQGAQWPQMCMELFDEFSVFRDAIAEMDCVLQELPHAPAWSLREIISEPETTSHVMDPLYSQPTCTAIQIGLVLLLQSWGIVPSASIGHSSGEIAAAFAAGFITVAEAITNAFYRGYVVDKTASTGGMVAAGVSEDAANEMINVLGITHKIKVACINSPNSVTISGDSPEIEIILKALNNNGLFGRKLHTQGRAYHSHHMLVFGDEYEHLIKVADSLKSGSKKLPLGPTWISSVTGDVVDSSSFKSSYWRINIERPVEFMKAVSHLALLDGQHYLVEVGPHSALELPIKQIRSRLGITEQNMPYSAVIIRNKNSTESVLNLAGNLYADGNSILFDEVNGLTKIKGSGAAFQPNYKVLYDLPTYHWTYASEPLWYEARLSSEFRLRKFPRHELLGSRIIGGVEACWRNVIRLEESPWLRDHKLGETVVVPGAGYLAMVIEALSQITDLPTNRNPVIRMKGIIIASALVLPASQISAPEIFTTLRPTPNSTGWWDFSIVSLYNDASTTHATGKAAMREEGPLMNARFVAPEGSLESSASRSWYDRLVSEGLIFGPQFQTITDFAICRLRKVQYCRAAVPLKHEIEHVELYPVHPVTMDAMFQASIVASTQGIISNLVAKVPTRIGFAEISLHAGVSKNDRELTRGEAWFINSTATTTDFGYTQANCELVRSDGSAKIRLESVRLAPYQGARLEATNYQRNPISQVIWKPDPNPKLMTDESLSAYLKIVAASKEAKHDHLDSLLQKIAACISIIGHKNPYIKVLELADGDGQTSKFFMETLSSGSLFPQLSSYTVGMIEDGGQLSATKVDLKTGKHREPTTIPPDLQFDLIILASYETSARYLQTMLHGLKARLSDQGLVIAASQKHEISLNEFGLSAIRSQDENDQLMLIYRSEADQARPDVTAIPTVIIERIPSAFGSTLMEELKQVSGQQARRLLFDELSHETNLCGTNVISLVEAGDSVLSKTSGMDWECIKILIDQSASLIWITSGNLLTGQSPDHSLVFGLSRAIMMEQPSLRFFTYDVDKITINSKQTARNIISIIKSQSSTESTDFEYIEKEGLVYISRFIPDKGMNEAFRQSQGEACNPVSLKASKNVQLSIKTPGQFDTIFFKEIHLPELSSHEIQVSVKYVSLNAHDLSSLKGQCESKTCLMEFCGIIEKVGTYVEGFLPGDRIYAMAPSYFRTSEIVPAWACQKLHDGEEFRIVSTFPFVCAAAIHSFRKAGLQDRERVLITSGAGGVGIAAIQLAQLIGADVFSTVSTEKKKEFLVKTLGVKPGNIFITQDSSCEVSLMEATNGSGFDVILNSLSGELLHTLWRCCGRLGRFVDISRRGEFGQLDMEPFSKGATYIASEITDLYYSPDHTHHMNWSELIKSAFELYRGQKFSSVPTKTFDIENISSAFKNFGIRDKIGKIAISLQRPSSTLMIEMPRYKLKLSSEKSYLMIGCLGGLGRSLAKWLLERGARKFVFLSRSGLSNSIAQRFVQDLITLGGEVKVVQGDVCDFKDVKRMIDEADGPIGGVVQAAMGVYPGLFNNMPNKNWHSGIDPKVKGTWNIHNAIKHKDGQLDFFLLTSSISGSIGSATEGNYCAANHFLDNFARYRRSLGLPATAIGLGMVSGVGYVHENPDVESLFLRKGIQQINESEMLTIVDISLSQGSSFCSEDGGTAAHVLTGLDPFVMLESGKQDSKGGNSIFVTSRALILARAIQEQTASTSPGTQSNNLPIDISQAIDSGISLTEAVTAYIAKQFGDLMMVPVEKIVPNRLEAERTNTKILSAVEGSVDEIRNNVQDATDSIKHLKCKKSQAEINRWLSAPDPSTNYNKAIQ
ncbi:hypothetical protein ABW20_dc0102273 [Dactylellina cionopaga]|nr:hypothetical protein ABW20_dc0102273 [Dactylellina cionopaga]